MSESAAIEAKLGLDTDDFQTGLRRAERDAQSASDRIGGAFKSAGHGIREWLSEPLAALSGGLALGGIFEAAKGLLEFGTAIKDAAERTNLSTEAFQELQFAFSQGGANAERFEKGIIKLNSSIEEAKSGSLEMIETLGRLGLSWDDLFRIPLDAQISKIAESVKGSIDPARTLADVMKAFGKSGAFLVPTLKEGAAGFAELRAQADKVSDENLKQMDAIEDRWAKGWRSVKVSAIQNLLEVKDWIKTNLGDGSAEMDYRGDYGMGGVDPNKNHGAGGSWEDASSSKPSIVVRPSEAPPAPAAEIAEDPREVAKAKEEAAQADARRLAINKEFADVGKETSEIEKINADTLKQQRETGRVLLSDKEKLADLEAERAEIASHIFEDGTKEDALAKQQLAHVDALIASEQKVTAEKNAQAAAAEAQKLSAQATLAAENAAAKHRAAVDLQKLSPSERAQAKRDAANGQRATERAESTLAARAKDKADLAERKDNGVNAANFAGKFKPREHLSPARAHDDLSGIPHAALNTTHAAVLQSGATKQSPKGEAAASIGGMVFPNASFPNATITQGP